MPEWFSRLYLAFFGPDLLVAPEYLLLSLIVAWLFYSAHRRDIRMSRGFWHWLMPWRIYGHRSVRLDLELYVLNRVLLLFGLAGRISLTTGAAVIVSGLFGPPAESEGALSPLLTALILWLTADFAFYWLHRWLHQIRRLWPIHAVHHSAAVMTPFTTYRSHPLEIVYSTIGITFLVGLAQGLLVGLTGMEASAAEIAGVNSFVLLSNLAFKTLHHSHVNLSFGPVLEHLVISPAQHQIHHSTNPAHYNRNLGSSLALWDWMFDTLYVIRGDEELTFGLSAPEDAPLMTQKLGPVLLDPLRRMVARQ